MQSSEVAPIRAWESGEVGTWEWAGMGVASAGLWADVAERTVEVKVPEPSDILAAIADVQAEFDGDRRTIAEWRGQYRQDLAMALQRSPLQIFSRFVNNLLERAMRGESWQRRMNAFQERFVSFEDIKDETVAKVLGKEVSGYRFPKDGLVVVMEAKRIVTNPGFTWAGYVEQANGSYESDFRSDEFLRIPGVGFKTRDLAVSELSDRFAAMDLHVVRVTARTGLLVHGYGNAEITTDVAKDSGYLILSRSDPKTGQANWLAGGRLFSGRDRPDALELWPGRLQGEAKLRGLPASRDMPDFQGRLPR